MSNFHDPLILTHSLSQPLRKKQTTLRLQVNVSKGFFFHPDIRNILFILWTEVCLCCPHECQSLSSFLTVWSSQLCENRVLDFTLSGIAVHCWQCFTLCPLSLEKLRHNLTGRSSICMRGKCNWIKFNNHRNQMWKRFADWMLFCSIFYINIGYMWTEPFILLFEPSMWHFLFTLVFISKTELFRMLFYLYLEIMNKHWNV